MSTKIGASDERAAIRHRRLWPTTIAYSGRNSTSAVQSRILTLSGQGAVTGSQSFDGCSRRIVRHECERTIGRFPGGTPAVGDVALAAHSCVLPPGAVTTDATVRTAEVGPANHSGTTPSPFKPQSGDGAVVSIGQIMWTKSGAGASQLRQIIATGITVLILSQSAETGVLCWATRPLMRSYRGCCSRSRRTQ